MAGAIKVKTTFRKKALKKAMENASFTSLWKAGSFIKTTASRSIRPRSRKKPKQKNEISSAQKREFLKRLRKKDAKVLAYLERKRTEDDKMSAEELAYRKASPVGTPPFTGARKTLRRSINFEVDKQHKDNVVIGTAHEDIGKIGRAHEHGGIFEGRHYPKRPFMSPALEIARPKLARMWKNSIKPF